MRTALAIFLLLHGLAHTPGFAVAWRLASPPEMPYKTTLLNGALDVGDTGIRVMGVCWLLAAIGFAAAALVTLRGHAAWPTITLGVSCFSLILGVLAWPDSRVGVILNVMLIVALLLLGRLRH
jgi:hypothetical protein